MRYFRKCQGAAKAILIHFLLALGSTLWGNFLLAQTSPPVQPSTSNQPVEYLIITSADLADAFDEFVLWKKRKGINTAILTPGQWLRDSSGVIDIADEAGFLRATLFQKYQEGLKYVLLAGDHTVLPVRYGTGFNNNTGKQDAYKIPSDLYFSDFDGNWDVDKDSLYGEPEDDVSKDPEIYVGRLLCSNQYEIRNWVQKILQYEQNPGNGDYEYLQKAFFTQADQMQEMDQARKIAALFQPVYKEVTIFEEPDFDSDEVPVFPRGSDVIREMNTNQYGLVSWFNHGKPISLATATYGMNLSCDSTPGKDSKRKITAFDSYDGGCDMDEDWNGLDNLTNSGYPFIIYTLACEVAPFDEYKYGNQMSLGKAFTVLPGVGGPAFLGNTRNGYVHSSFRLYKKFVSHVVDSGNYNLGVAEALSRRDINSHFVSLSHHLIGCPETQLWTNLPAVFENVEVQKTETGLYISTGGPAASMCVMSQDGGKTYWKVVRNAKEYEFQNIPDTVYVTLTKPNYIPYQVSVF